MCWELANIVLGKTNLFIFDSHFFNMDISDNIVYRPFNFLTCIVEIQMEGSVSQNVDMGPSFYFMKY